MEPKRLVTKITTPPKQPFVRAAFSQARAGVRGGSAFDVLAQRWPDDEAAQMILSRAAVSGATTTGAGWAAELAQSSFRAFLGDLGATSAASRLITMGMPLDLGAETSVTFPVRNGAPAQLPWVDEIGRIPVLARSIRNVTLGPPKKMAAIVVWSQELDKRSNARTVFEQMLREDIACSLDLAYFSAQAGTGGAHAGLLNGVSPLTASAARGLTALQEDLAALISAVSGAGSSGQVVIAMSTKDAAVFPVRAPELASKLIILPTTALDDGEVIAIDPLSLIHSVAEQPEIDWAKEATIHMDDAPANISTAGSPPVVAHPTVSLFQTARAGLRVLFDIAFAKRRSDAVAWVQGADWSASA